MTMGRDTINVEQSEAGFLRQLTRPTPFDLEPLEPLWPDNLVDRPTDDWQKDQHQQPRDRRRWWPALEYDHNRHDQRPKCKDFDDNRSGTGQAHGPMVRRLAGRGKLWPVKFAFQRQPAV
jgi:hypothetical protein